MATETKNTSSKPGLPDQLSSEDPAEGRRDIPPDTREQADKGNHNYDKAVYTPPSHNRYTKPTTSKRNTTKGLSIGSLLDRVMKD